jgi:hypothetical protein
MRPVVQAPRRWLEMAMRLVVPFRMAMVMRPTEMDPSYHSFDAIYQCPAH